MHQETVPILAEDVFALLGDKQSVEYDRTLLVAGWDSP